MLVHPHGPLVGGEAAEEAVGMGGAAGGTAGGEAVDDGDEFVAFGGEVAVVRDLKAGNGGRVAAHGLALFECHGLDDAPNEAADQHARRTAFAESQLHRDGAVRHGLRWRHLAPQARAVRTQLREAVFQFLHRIGLPEGLRAGDRPETGFELMISAPETRGAMTEYATDALHVAPHPPTL